jgi:hypothetical protein
MQEIPALLGLPAATLVPIAVGFLCYRLAFVGRDGHHSGSQMVLTSVVFAAIVRAVCEIATAYVQASAALALGVATGVLAAIAWRKVLAERAFKAMRKMRIVTADGQPTAVQSVLASDRGKLTEICVWTASGQAFISEHIHRFEEEPKGPFWIGPDGSVALYVTSIMDPATKEWTAIDPLNDDWGTRLTIVPGSQVARLDLRYR